MANDNWVTIKKSVLKIRIIKQQNKLTGKIRKSRDGGKTWQMIG